jgi:hypothetical protein
MQKCRQGLKAPKNPLKAQQSEQGVEKAAETGDKNHCYRIP